MDMDMTTLEGTRLSKKSGMYFSAERAVSNRRVEHFDPVNLHNFFAFSTYL